MKYSSAVYTKIELYFGNNDSSRCGKKMNTEYLGNLETNVRLGYFIDVKKSLICASFYI